MKERWRSVGAALLSLALAGSLCLGPAGAEELHFVDLPEDHWAYEELTAAVELGILRGMGDDRLAPNEELTWGQYLTMLSRVYAPEAYETACESSAWDVAAYETCLEVGLLNREDILPVCGENLSSPLRRQDVALLMVRALGETWLEEHADTTVQPPVDLESLEEDYRPAVLALLQTGIARGSGDGAFHGEGLLRRADGAIFLLRGVEAQREIPVEIQFVDEVGETVQVIQTAALVGQSGHQLVAEHLPSLYQLAETVDFKVTGEQESYIIPVRFQVRYDLDMETAVEAWWWGELTEEEYFAQDFWLTVQGENERKHELLFGSAEKRRFSSREEAELHMTQVTVPVWRLDGAGNKVSGQATFTIHEALAEDVKAVFTEIYNDPERFPFSDWGGYSWRGDQATGEHNCGTAIDLNVNGNYQVREGVGLVGDHWTPGEDPYSMPEDGSVVRIFAEHGWSWGGNAWSWDSDPTTGYHDYMHFSYMGG